MYYYEFLNFNFTFLTFNYFEYLFKSYLVILRFFVHNCSSWFILVCEINFFVYLFSENLTSQGKNPLF